MKKQNGITLIALVITIIILLILAGIVINLTLGEHGILNKAEQAGEQYKIGAILEKLELEKVDLYARKNGEMPSIEEYVEHLISKGIITDADVEDLDENTKNITVEGYVFTVEKDQGGDIKITYQRKADNKARIAKLEVTKTTINSISVKVVTSNVSGGSYKYSIKDVTAGETSFTEVTTITANEYTFTSLATDHEYVIQVELISNNGGDVKETETIKTEPPKVTKITLDKTEIELLKGKTETITAEVIPEEAVDKTLTWTSSNEEVVTVNSEGVVTAVGKGVAKITATATSGVSASCNVTVTLPTPPTVGVGAETHEAKQIPYTWEELNSIAKVISDNYGEEAGKINNDTAEVAVVVNGEEGTLGIGDWTTVNEKKVRILGFNHDTLTNQEVYEKGKSNTCAGISFEFVDFIITKSHVNGGSNTKDGWGTWVLRSTLNNTTYNSLENKEYIKEVSKEYIAKYNDATSVTMSSDYLWLLSRSELWSDWASGSYASIAKDGELYKYYSVEIGNLDAFKKGVDYWFLRTPRKGTQFTCMLRKY